jgi:hypothetical protein
VQEVVVMQDRLNKMMVKDKDALDSTDTVPIAQIESEEQELDRQDEELEWRQQFEYLMNHLGEAR